MICCIKVLFDCTKNLCLPMKNLWCIGKPYYWFLFKVWVLAPSKKNIYSVVLLSNNVIKDKILSLKSLLAWNQLFLVLHSPNILSKTGTCIAEVTGSNPVEALIFFRLLLSKLTAMIILHFHLQPQFKYVLRIISLLTRDTNSTNWPRSQCVASYMAQLVEQPHWYRRGHGFKSRWSPDFFRLLSNCLNWKIKLLWSFFTFKDRTVSLRSTLDYNQTFLWFSFFADEEGFS